MSRPLRIAIVLAASALFAGCNQDPKGMFADFRWGVLCSGSGSCTMDSPPREVLGYDGHPNEGDTSGDVNVSCTWLESGDLAILSLTALQPGYAIRVDGIVVDTAGGFNQSAECEVTVAETEPFDLGLVGACKVGETDPSAPCQVEVEVSTIDGDPTVTVNLLCDGITSPSDPVNIVRDVALGSVTATPSDPAVLQIRNCDGL